MKVVPKQHSLACLQKAIYKMAAITLLSDTWNSTGHHASHDIESGTMRRACIDGPTPCTISPEELERRFSDVRFCLSRILGAVSEEHDDNLEIFSLLVPFVSFFMQSILFKGSVNALEVAAENARRRRTGNRGLERQEMERGMRRLRRVATAKKIQAWLMVVLSCMFLFDKLPGAFHNPSLEDDFEPDGFEPDYYEPAVLSASLAKFLRVLRTRSLFGLMAKDPVRVSEHHEWYRLLTCMIVHEDWKQLLLGCCLLELNFVISLQKRMGMRKVIEVSLLASLGAALFHFTHVPGERRVGVECISYLFIGMQYADISVNFDLLMTVSQLHWRPEYSFSLCEPWSYPILGLIGLLGLVIGTCCFYSNPRVTLSYLIYGFCVSLPFIPRLDEAHPGFLGHRPTKGCLRFMTGTKIVCFSVAMISVLIYMVNGLSMY